MLQVPFFFGGGLALYPITSIEVLLQKSPWFGMTRWWRNWVTWSFPRATVAVFFSWFLGVSRCLNGYGLTVYIGAGIHRLVELRRFGQGLLFRWKLLIWNLSAKLIRVTCLETKTKRARKKWFFCLEPFLPEYWMSLEPSDWFVWHFELHGRCWFPMVRASQMAGRN